MSEQAAVAAGPASKHRSVVSKHPNASLALGSGSGVGALTVWLVGLSGTQMPPEVGAVTGGIIAAVFLFVGRRGIKGTIVRLWRGSE